MSALPIVVVVLDLILPIALLLWALKARAKSRLYLASIWLSTALVIAVLAKSIVGFWHAVGVDYALDIVKLNALGLSAAGFFPQDLQKYPAFGADVVAPCAGEVISTESTRPNRRPLDPDGEDRTGGNHVII